MMTKKVKKIAIVMDEIDGMNNGDKGGITALIKIIRQKKTKKQRLENMTMKPIICIGNYYIDKKIKELMKVCNTFELKSPTRPQMTKVIDSMFLTINAETTKAQTELLLNYIQGDMRKLMFVKDMFSKKPELMTEQTLQTIFHIKSYNEDSKKITQSLINAPAKMEEHNRFMNETDRTIVALLWHENIVDVIPKQIEKSLPFYLNFLDNVCYSDYIDRITFQNQIWHFNEMSSLMKTFNNNRLFHLIKPETPSSIQDVRFTKVLTKYSTEYNNIEFIYDMCQKLDMDKKDLLSLFQELRIFYLSKKLDVVNDINVLNTVEKMFETYDINKLDIKRMYRYLDKNVKKDVMIDDFDTEDAV
jgi:hypothetical protein